MDWSWLESEEEVEGNLWTAGLSLHDKWLFSSIHRKVEEPTRFECVLCTELWPEELLWPGRMKLRVSPEEASDVYQLTATGDGQRRVHLPHGTQILNVAGEDVSDISVVDFLPPSFCPACCRTVQRRPQDGEVSSCSVIVRTSSIDPSNIPMRIALDCAQNVFAGDSADSMIVSEEMLELGNGQRALRLVLPSAKVLHNTLRVGVPGCFIDYLPSPDNLTVSVYAASLHSRDVAGTLSANEVSEWLVSAGKCHIKNTFQNSTSVIVELGSVDSWHRALALNGELCNGTVLKVSPATDNEIPFRAPRRVVLFWLWAMRPLGTLAKRLVLAFLGKAPIMVPNDALLQEALDQNADIIIRQGHYRLQELTVRSPVEIIGESGVFLHVTSPIQIRSEFGGHFRNLNFLAENPASKQSKAIRSLISIQCSYLLAIARGHRSYSDQTPMGGKAAFACCSLGRYAVTFSQCSFRGGHHGLDIRGGCGVRSRGSPKTATALSAALAESESLRFRSFDLGPWMERGREHRERRERKGEDSDNEATAAMASIEFRQDGKSWRYIPCWRSYIMTLVKLIDCEICDAEAEAINIWRGGRVEMTHTSIHHCGQGVTASHYETPSDLKFRELEVSPHVLIRDCLFEHISCNDWSSAISLGRFMTNAGSSESDLTKTYIRHGKSFGEYNLKAELHGNTMRLCNSGVIASQCHLYARKNKADRLKFGAYQIFNGDAFLEENQVHQCGTAVCARSGICLDHGCSAKLELRSNTLADCGIGMRLASAAKTSLQMQLTRNTLSRHGDGVSIRGPCHVVMEHCKVADCHRIGVNVLEGASIELLNCHVSQNGRGVVIAPDGHASINECIFKDNTGWAVRFEGHDKSEGARSSLINSIFHTPSKGNAGRKRVRVDTRTELVLCLCNREGEDGPVFEPEVKSKKTQLLEEMAALSLTSKLN